MSKGQSRSNNIEKNEDEDFLLGETSNFMDLPPPPAPPALYCNYPMRNKLKNFAYFPSLFCIL